MANGSWQRWLDRRFAERYDALTASAERAWLADERTRLLAMASGDVIELGAGTGANHDHWPAGLTSLTLVEPAPDMRRRLARRYADRTPAPALLDRPAEALGLPDASADTVVSTLVLCSVTDVAAVAREVRRVLRPGGRLVLLEHVRSPGGYAVAQDAVTPLTRRLAAGCPQNRDVLAALRAAGFDTSGVHDTGRSVGLLVRPVVSGVAGVSPG